MKKDFGRVALICAVIGMPIVSGQESGARNRVSKEMPQAVAVSLKHWRSLMDAGFKGYDVLVKSGKHGASLSYFDATGAGVTLKLDEQGEVVEIAPFEDPLKKGEEVGKMTLHFIEGGIAWEDLSKGVGFSDMPPKEQESFVYQLLVSLFQFGQEKADRYDVKMNPDLEGVLKALDSAALNEEDCEGSVNLLKFARRMLKGGGS